VKKVFLFFWLLFALQYCKAWQNEANKSAAQLRPAQVFNLDKLPDSDTLLRGWKIMSRDNRQYAAVDYDDNKWKDFDPSKDINTLNNKGSAFWLRLHLKINSNLNATDLALMTDQNVASEIFVDGKLFKSYGVVSGNIQAFNPADYPVPVKLLPGSHLIAVHIAIQQGLPELRSPDYTTPIFNLYINQYNKAISNYEEVNRINQKIITENLLLIGIFFILTVIHFVSYCYYRKQKAHFYYAIITFILLFDTYINIAVINQHSPLMFFWLNLIGMLSFTGFIFLPLTIYALFGYKRRLFLKIIVAISALSVLTLWINSAYTFYLFYMLIPLINAAECVRAGMWARKNKKRGALIVVTGSCLFLLLLAVQNLISGSLGDLLFMLSLISLPVGMTVFLAIQTATTYRSLETKFIEVQELSEKNLEYQLEKQHLLADQNEKLEQQVVERTSALNESLNHLKQTQAQLIQSEKMASLGELTAGIAHEIQNPLNFVNNFSEVSVELLDELKEEAEAGNKEDVIAIANDLSQNLQKINHHGKRADAIVKGMLQHSKSGSGSKEPTNINALVDEFLKLSYHGLRAKDKNFNAVLTTHFGEGVPKVNIVQQDIGRVLLNVFNNAFYAVNQKQKTAGPAYKPEVSVTTTSGNGQIMIKVMDNGTGIPAAIKDKIMQPFFTTKPTGEGTGLGLSLGYDIIVQGHGGGISITSTEGEGSEFLITLPF